METNLAQIFRIKKMLKKIKYPDSYRIAREIVVFLQKRKGVTEEQILKRLYKDEPWEYVRGSADFCNLGFSVNKHTLIPRVETEQIVSDCLKIVKDENIKNIIDVGTGSGCIIISIASKLKNPKDYSLYGCDVSKRALKVAKKNEKNILKKRSIKWLSGDLIKKVPKLKGPTLLIANLPYIPTEQYESLEDSVKEYEPRLALDGGEKGIDLYRKLFKQILEGDLNVKEIFLETEASVYNETISLIKKSFEKAKIKKVKDCFDKNRFVKVSL